MNALYVAAGSAVGGVLRWLLGAALNPVGTDGRALPLGTLVVNVAGSFIVGVLAVLAARQAGDGATIRLLLMVGFCGGFTTMSTFSLETTSLIERGATGTAALYVVGTLALAFAGTFAGMMLARLVVAPRAG